MVLYSWFKKKMLRENAQRRENQWMGKEDRECLGRADSHGARTPGGTRLRAPRNSVELSRQLGDGRKDGLPDASMRGERQALACCGDRLTRVWCTWAGPVWTPGEGGLLGLGPVVEIRSGGV